MMPGGRIGKIADVRYDVTFLTDQDIYLFKKGHHFRLYDKLGSHVATVEGAEGVYFAVWAPNAERVSVIGDFNNWNCLSHRLRAREDGSGIWEGYIGAISHGVSYKYHIVSKYNRYIVDKGDPYAFRWESPPKTASRVWDIHYSWGDGVWMKNRHVVNGLDHPLAIYEVHLGSWRRVPEEENRFLTYRELAPYLIDYVKDLRFTHVEFMPVMEHPFYGSWGYEIVGYFAPTARYGSPQDFMYLIDSLHQNGIGIILDWVPSHFPDNEHGLIYFDGTHLYEYADPRQGFQPEWKSYVFNHSRSEVAAFLISSAFFWLDRYHADALRVDAVASMLYLDYGRKAGEWIPNKCGGRENLEAIAFIKRFNEAVYREFPDVQTIAEESTAWPMVSRPTYVGGLGFGLKWNMGWMHDTLEYFSQDPIYRKYRHDKLTFVIWYAFSENFLLPLSHDEVVFGKGSLIRKMPGDDWQKFANLRLLLGYMYSYPGKKLLFMGDEFGQWDEWYHERSLDWHLLAYPYHHGVQGWVKDLNRICRTESALHEIDFAPEGFEWIDFRDSDSSVISFIRRGKSTDDIILAVCNFTPVSRNDYRIGVPRGGLWKEILNSDAQSYGGSGYGNLGAAEATPVSSHGRPYSLSLMLPPLAVVFFKSEKGGC